MSRKVARELVRSVLIAAAVAGATACGVVRIDNGRTTPAVAASPSPSPVVSSPPANAPAATVHGGKIEINQAILFETDRAVIRPESSAILDQVVSVMQANPEIRRVRVEGHTDLRGDASHNRTLSRERAAAVVQYLRGHGVTTALESEGFGLSRPLCQEDTEECHGRNRRVEFVILDPASH